MRNEEKDLKALASAFFKELTLMARVEYGSIGLDPKRPFGNSFVEGDMLELIGWKPEGDKDEEEDGYSSEQREYVNTLYKEKLIPYLQRRWKELP